MNKFNPLVSIIIPVYNGSNYMAEAIDSALTQTYSNVEVLVINDGSKDNEATRNIALSYGERIRYFEKENGGVATALNLGIAEMKGEYFSWLSHDDKYFPHKIEKQIDFLSQLSNKEVVLYSDLAYIDEDSKTISNLHFPHYSPENFRPAFIMSDLISGCTLLIPKICFETCGIFDVTLRTTQDYDLWFRIAEKFDFIHQSDILISSRIHKNQDTFKLSKVVIDERDNLQLNFIKYIYPNEIIRFSNGNIAGYYIEFAGKMSKWRLSSAKNFATKKAMHNLFSSGISNAIQNLFKLFFLSLKDSIISILGDDLMLRFKKNFGRHS